MATLKTQPSEQNVMAYLDQIEDPQQKEDALSILEMMKGISKEPPKMWGDSMVGFGSYHYKYASGREGDWFLTGFSPRKKQISLYIMAGFEAHEDLLKNLGKYKTGKSCLYIKKLSDIDTEVLEKLIRKSVEYMREKYPS